MGKFLKDETAIRMLNSIAFTESFPQGRRAPNRRVIRTIGGGSANRPFVEITEVQSSSDYIGKVFNGPNDAESTIEDVAIKVDGAVSNPFQEGYRAFADKVTTDGNDIYYIDGFPLG